MRYFSQITWSSTSTLKNVKILEAWENLKSWTGLVTSICPHTMMVGKQVRIGTDVNNDGSKSSRPAADCRILPSERDTRLSPSPLYRGWSIIIWRCPSLPRFKLCGWRHQTPFVTVGLQHVRLWSRYCRDHSPMKTELDGNLGLIYMCV